MCSYWNQISLVFTSSLSVSGLEKAIFPKQRPAFLKSRDGSRNFLSRGEESRLWSRKHRYFSLHLGLNTSRTILRQVDFTYFTLGSITWYLVVARILVSNKERCERGEGHQDEPNPPLLIFLCIGPLHVVTKGSVTASVIVTNQWEIKLDVCQLSGNPRESSIILDLCLSSLRQSEHEREVIVREFAF